MRRFVKNQRRGNRAQLFEPCAPRGGARRQKAGEEKLISRQSGCNQRRDEGCGPGYGNDLNAPLNRGPDDAKTRIANQRRARVRNDGDVVSGFQEFAKLFGALALVVFVITDRLCLDAKAIQQSAGVARVFTSDQIDFAQHA